MLAVPGGLSFALLAVEGLAINGLLAARADSAALLAAWSIVDRAARFLTMPVVAVGVALLPLAARLWGAQDPNGIRRELKTGLIVSAGYVLLFVLPLTLLLAGPVARGLTDAQQAQEAARQGIRLASLAVALGAPMFLLRSTFEGMQQPRPGLLVSGLRTIVFLVPLAWLGLRFAPSFGGHGMQGLVVGLSLAAGISSALLLVWMRALPRGAFGGARAARKLDRPLARLEGGELGLEALAGSSLQARAVGGVAGKGELLHEGVDLLGQIAVEVAQAEVEALGSVAHAQELDEGRQGEARVEGRGLHREPAAHRARHHRPEELEGRAQDREARAQALAVRPAIEGLGREPVAAVEEHAGLAVALDLE